MLILILGGAVLAIGLLLAAFVKAFTDAAVEQLARAEQPAEPPPMRRFPPPW